MLDALVQVRDVGAAVSTSPVRIIITPTGAHLADSNNDTAWCGADVRLRPSFQLEPGSDFGEHRDDCRRCVAKAKTVGLA